MQARFRPPMSSPILGVVLVLVAWLATRGDVLARPVGTPELRCKTPFPHEAYAPRGFLGFACRDDRCTSHKAGFDWAERNGIAEARACVTRNDRAFAEGCRVFVERAATAEQAGFEWARENELDDRCLCTGAGMRFEAGCQAYVEGFAE
jgi:hypothetical protein